MISPKCTLADRLLWDIPLQQRDKLKAAIQQNPAEVIRNDEKLLVKTLSSISWYELLNLFGPEELHEILTDQRIAKLFPTEKRNYYKNARRLLSEYTLSTPR